ncbi:probable nucleoredoxin 1 [Magnolia sinica]|uniref:probable nucleoredoxin 1 n=1 Tax=Magnolia sinica TaxID=86752 RepID=UPI002659258F|nr:probable nucleoredoxin 1 [Magnolia sinica]
MAEIIATANGDFHDLKSLLSAKDRDYLVQKNGDQVKLANLDGKIVALYFSASQSSPCQRFFSNSIEIYQELAAKGDFEAIFISRDKDEKSFNEYSSKMPWPTIPFSDSTTRDRLIELFQVKKIPRLVILNGEGKILRKNGVSVITEYGADAYPFTEERLEELREEEENEKKNQTLRSFLVSRSRDFLNSNDGNRVPVSDLEGKMVGLYFSLSSLKPCREFTTNLIEIYGQLKEREENFEIVLISLDNQHQSFKEEFERMPWLALPFMDKGLSKLIRYFDLKTLPTLVIIDTDGKTLHSNAVKMIENHGIQAYPFTAERLAELVEIEKSWLKSQTLESLLVSEERDFVIGKRGVKVPVADLVGKHILLYFSAQWCPPCRAFLPKLIKAYHEIKAKDDAFEVIFVSNDSDEASFDDFFSEMPWLALPFGDGKGPSLMGTFQVSVIPTLIAIGPTGKMITKEARDLIKVHGPQAYPFTEEHLKEMEAQVEEMAKRWPEKVSHLFHVEHELVLTRRTVYICNGCKERGLKWSYYCEECDFNLHPRCALEENKKEDGDDMVGHVDSGHDGDVGDEETFKDGCICDGEVCYKAYKA